MSTDSNGAANFLITINEVSQEISLFYCLKTETY